MTRDSFGKLRFDLEEYFSSGEEARAFFDKALLDEEIVWTEKLLIASFSRDRFGDEIFDETFELSGESLREARENAQKIKEPA